MLLRSGFSYELSAAATTSSSSTSNRCGRKRKSVDDELDERPLKRQETTLVLQGEPSGSHPFPLVAPPSSFNPPSSPPPPSELPFTRENSCDSDATVAIDDDNSSVATVALEDDHAGDERGPRRVHFNTSVIEYLFEVDDEPSRVVDVRHFAYLHYEDMHSNNNINSNNNNNNSNINKSNSNNNSSNSSSNNNNSNPSLCADWNINPVFTMSAILLKEHPCHHAILLPPIQAIFKHGLSNCAIYPEAVVKLMAAYSAIATIPGTQPNNVFVDIMMDELKHTVAMVTKPNKDTLLVLLLQLVLWDTKANGQAWWYTRP